MAVLTDQALITICNARVRPACEIIYGLQILGTEDSRILTGFLPVVPSDGTVLDGADVSAFTGQMFHDYLGLLNDLLGAANQPPVQALLQTACVRPLDAIISGLPHGSDASDGGNAVVTAIQARIRPRCLVLRAVRYMLANHLNVIPPMVALYQAADIIDDGHFNQLSIGLLQVFLAFAQAATDPSTVSTAARGMAIDYGAGTPLLIGY